MMLAYKNALRASAATISFCVMVWAQPVSAQSLCQAAAQGTFSCDTNGAQTATGNTSAPLSAPSSGLAISSPGDLTASLLPGLDGASISTVAGYSHVVTLDVAGALTLDAGDVMVTSDGYASLGYYITANSANVMVGDVSTQADFSRGIDLAALDGAVVSVGSVETAGDYALAVKVDAGSGNAQVSTGSLLTDGYDAGGVRLSGSGQLSVSSTAIQTSGDQSIGITVSGGTAVDLSVQSIETLGAFSDGINAQSIYGDITATVGSVSTAGDNARGVYLIGFNVDATIGDITTTGTAATGVAITTTSGSIQVSQADDDFVHTSGAASDAVVLDGIGIGGNLGNIVTTGGGARGVVVTTAGMPIDLAIGNVSTTAGGIVADTGGSPVGVAITARNIATSEDGAAGVAIVANDGPVSLDLNSVATVGSGSHGVFVASTGDVSIQSGSITTAGTGADGVRVDGADVATVQIEGTTRANGGFGINLQNVQVANVSIKAGATVEGESGGIFLGGAASNSLNLAGNLQSIGSTAALTASGGATDISLGQSAVLKGFVTLSDSNDDLLVDGRWMVSGVSNFGGGLDTLRISATGSLIGNSGIAGLAGLETLNNSGTIQLSDGAADDQLSINGDYVGTGGAIALDLVGSATGYNSDRFIIGGSVSGSTLIDVAISTPMIDLNGVQLISVTGDVTASNFALKSSQLGLLDMHLETRDQGIFLVSEAAPRAVDYLSIHRVGNDLWFQSTDVISDALNSARAAPRDGFSAWGTVYAAQGKRGEGQHAVVLFGAEKVLDERLDTDRRGAQLGLNYSFGRSHVGVSGGYEKADVSTRNDSDIKTDGFNLAVSAGLQAGAMFANVIAKYDRYDLKIHNALAQLERLNLDGSSFGLRGEIGNRWTISAVHVEGSVGGSWVRSKLDDFTVGEFAFRNPADSQLLVNAGVRGILESWGRPFLGVKLNHQLSGPEDAYASIAGDEDRIALAGKATWVRAEVGLSGTHGLSPTAKLWLNAGDVKGLGIQAGVRF